MKTKMVEMHGQRVKVTLCPPATAPQMQGNGRAAFGQTIALKVSGNSAERTTGIVDSVHHDPGRAYQPIEELREEALEENQRARMSEAVSRKEIQQRRRRVNPYSWRDWCAFAGIETNLSARQYFACHPIARTYTPHYKPVPDKKPTTPRKPFTRSYTRRKKPAKAALKTKMAEIHGQIVKVTICPPA